MESFRLFLVRRGFKETTVSGYVGTLKRVLDNTTLEAIDSYLLQLVEQKKKTNYLNNIVATLRLYGQHINHEQLKVIPFFKREKTEKGILSEDEINKIIALPPEPHVQGSYLWHYKKNSLLWKCSSYSGARIGELASITVDCVDFGQMIFRVNGKTGFRSIPINPALKDDLVAHIKTLKGKYLFPSMRTDRPMERSSWNFDFKNRLKRLGIKRNRVTPHSLRHTFITRMLDEDVNLFAVQRIVGHSQTETTAQYYHYGMKKGQAAIRRDPLGRKQLTKTEKYFAVRDGLRKLLSDYCSTPEEEREMREELLKSN